MGFNNKCFIIVFIVERVPTVLNLVKVPMKSHLKRKLQNYNCPTKLINLKKKLLLV